MNLNKIFVFLSKYRLLLILLVLIILMVIIRFGNKNEVVKKEEIIKITPTATQIRPEIQEMKVTDLNKMNREEYYNFLDSLTEEERNQLPIQIYSLEFYLPHEEETFEAIEMIKQDVLLVRSKIEDKSKAKENINKWLESVDENPNRYVLIWK